MSGAHVAIAHAIIKKRQEEEEKMGYNQEELEKDWEFKIIKSPTGKFKKYSVVEQVKAEEAEAGWLMVEKFDNNRIRFKRSRKAMENDPYLPPHIDPYRTNYGISEAALAFSILGVIFAGIGVLLTILYFAGVLQ
jgi:hypothetical protein